MIKYIAKRLGISLLVLLLGSLLMFILVINAGDPLADLRESNSPNRDNLIRQRTLLLGLDKPWYERYLNWIGGAAKCLYGQCDLGTASNGQSVNALIASGGRGLDPVGDPGHLPGHHHRCHPGYPDRDPAVQRIRLRHHDDGLRVLLPSGVLVRGAAEAVRRHRVQQLDREGPLHTVNDSGYSPGTRLHRRSDRRRSVEAAPDHLRDPGRELRWNHDLLRRGALVPPPRGRHPGLHPVGDRHRCPDDRAHQRFREQEGAQLGGSHRPGEHRRLFRVAGGS